MGIPVVSIIGKGPQFNKKFALRQKNLLGETLVLTNTTEEATSKLEMILLDKEEAKRLGEIGTNRMRCDGGSLEIARYISETNLAKRSVSKLEKYKRRNEVSR